jgi:hypothetical protein
MRFKEDLNKVVQTLDENADEKLDAAEKLDAEIRLAEKADTEIDLILMDFQGILESNDEDMKNSLMMTIEDVAIEYGLEPEELKAWISGKSLEEDQEDEILGDMPKEFMELNRDIGMSAKALRVYFEIYERTPEEIRMPMNLIQKNLQDVYQLTEGMSDNTRNEALVQMLGFSLDEKSTKIKSLILKLKLVKAQNKINVLMGEKEELQEKINRSKSVIAGMRETMANLTSENTYLKNFNRGDIIENISERILEVKRNLLAREDKMNALDAEVRAEYENIFSSQLKLMETNGTDKNLIETFLLDAYSGLENKMPDDVELKEAIENAIISQSKKSEFVRLFYQENKPSEAISAIIKDVEGGDDQDYTVSFLYQSYLNEEISEVMDVPENMKKYLEEGFICLKDQYGLYILMKEDKDGGLDFTRYQKDGTLIPGTEAVIPKWRREQVLGDRSNLEKALIEDPSLKQTGKLAGEFAEKLMPLQNLFQAGIEGYKTENFVMETRGLARDLSGTFNKMKTSLPTVKIALNKLQRLSRGPLADVVTGQIEQLSEMIKVVEDRKIEEFFIKILDVNLLKEDNLVRFLIDNSDIISAVVAAALIAVTIASFVTPVGWIMAGAMMTGGFLVSREVGAIGGHYAGKMIYGDGYEKRTLLGSYVMEEEVYNEGAGEYEKVGLGRLALTYSVDAAFAFCGTAVARGLMPLAGRALGSFTATNVTRSGIRGASAKMISNQMAKRTARRAAKVVVNRTFRQKLVRNLSIRLTTKLSNPIIETALLGPGTVTGVVSGLIRKTPNSVEIHRVNLAHPNVRRLTQVLTQEFFEEIDRGQAEIPMEHVNSYSNFLALLYKSLDGENYTRQFPEFKMSSHGFSENGNKITTYFQYEEGQEPTLLEIIKDTYGDQATISNKNGEIALSYEYNSPEKGQCVAEVRFVRSTVGVFMRQHQAELEERYRVKPAGEDPFYFYSPDSGEDVSLKRYMQEKGFVIESEKDGVVAMRKSDEVVKFVMA